MTSAFARFPPRLQEAIASRLGWSSLRSVQEMAGHALLDGKNAVILAPTAGGKTEASIFPLLATLMEREPQGVGLIYIAPIKALLNNQAERLGLYTEMVGLRRFLWHGDIKDSEKRAFIKEPTAVLMTTPESLEVMLLSAKVPHAQLFGDLRALVVDEVHAPAGTDRGAHQMSVVERLIGHTLNDVQRVGLSATVGNPVDILKWLQGTSKRKSCVVDPPKTPSPKDLRVYLRENLGVIANDASKTAQGKKSLFFCQSRALAEEIAERMRNRGIDVFVHHSSVSLEERAAAEERFHRGTNASIVCTSTLELGIDVGDLDYLFIAGGLLSMGEQAERVFGRKNFMELYAVFSSPLLYKVQTGAGYVVGSLEQAFVDKLVPEMSSFLLGGRAWTVIHINHEERTVRVVLAPRGKKPSWGGFLPQLLGFEICQQIADILQTEDSIPYINVSAQAALDECRADLKPLLQNSGHSIQTEPNRVLWWTFAGGQINHTLKYGLQFHHDWKIVADNFRLKIQGDSVSATTLSLAIAQMSNDAFWNAPSTKRFIFEQLPEYRLSKFQQALPESYSLEMIGDYLLDIPGAVLFLQTQEKMVEQLQIEDFLPLHQ
jgi:Lhr-like helicase